MMYDDSDIWKQVVGQTILRFFDMPIVGSTLLIIYQEHEGIIKFDAEHGDIFTYYLVDTPRSEPNHFRRVHKLSFIGFEGDILHFMGTKSDLAMMFSIDSSKVSEIQIMACNKGYTLLSREGFDAIHCHATPVPDETPFESCDGLGIDLVNALGADLRARFDEAGQYLDGHLAVELARDLMMQVAGTLDDMLVSETEKRGIELPETDSEAEEDESQTRLEAYL